MIIDETFVGIKLQHDRRCKFGSEARFKARAAGAKGGPGGPREVRVDGFIAGNVLECLSVLYLMTRFFREILQGIPYGCYNGPRVCLEYVQTLATKLGLPTVDFHQLTLGNNEKKTRKSFLGDEMLFFMSQENNSKIPEKFYESADPMKFPFEERFWRGTFASPNWSDYLGKYKVYMFYITAAGRNCPC